MARAATPATSPSPQASAQSRPPRRKPKRSRIGSSTTQSTTRPPVQTHHQGPVAPLFCPCTKRSHPRRTIAPSQHPCGFRGETRIPNGFRRVFGEKSACKKVTFDTFHVRIHPQRPSGCSWASCPTFKVAARGVQTSFRSCAQRDGRSKPKKARLGLDAGEVPQPLSVPTD